jgi:hypothetical protein
MPRYFFDIKEGHRLVGPSGSDCKNDGAAIEKARVIAIGVSLDKPTAVSRDFIGLTSSPRANARDRTRGTRTSGCQSLMDLG